MGRSPEGPHPSEGPLLPLLLLLHLGLLCAPLPTGAAVLSPPQAASLLAFGTALFGAALLPANWTQAGSISSPKDLPYVTALNGSVVALSIVGIGNGSRPLPSVANFTALTSLAVPFNTLTDLHSSVASLKRLRNLDASHNRLPGLLPSWVSNLTALSRLDLSYNVLSGPISPALLLPPLAFLSLRYNKLGAALPLLWQPSLTFLDLSVNFLAGPARIKFGNNSARCSALRLNNNCLDSSTSPCITSINSLATCNAYCHQGFSTTPCYGLSDCIYSPSLLNFTCPSWRPPPPPCTNFIKKRCDPVDKANCTMIPGGKAWCVVYYNCFGVKCVCPHQYAAYAKYNTLKELIYCGPRIKTI